MERKLTDPNQTQPLAIEARDGNALIASCILSPAWNANIVKMPWLPNIPVSKETFNCAVEDFGDWYRHSLRMPWWSWIASAVLVLVAMAVQVSLHFAESEITWLRHLLRAVHVASFLVAVVFMIRVHMTNMRCGARLDMISAAEFRSQVVLKVCWTGLSVASIGLFVGSEEENGQ